MRRLALIVIGSLGACASEQLPVERHEIGPLEYEMPSTWQPTPRSQGGRQIVEWIPSQNARRESITLIYSEPLPALAKAGAAAAVERLAAAQGGLRGSFEQPSRFRSKRGFDGARVTGSFTPPGQRQPFTRSHAVVLAGDHLIHLIYTAPRAASNPSVLSAVVDSLQRKGA